MTERDRSVEPGLSPEKLKQRADQAKKDMEEVTVESFVSTDLMQVAMSLHRLEVAMYDSSAAIVDCLECILSNMELGPK